MSTVKEILRVKECAGDVGIEIECEGNHMNVVESRYWKTEADGSLRGRFPEESAEFILRKPIKIDEVEAAMTELKANLPDAEFAFSFRTSVHVHVNVQKLEYNQLLAFMYGYLLLEEPLMNFCGKQRKGNRFCLRMVDAEGLSDVMHTLFRNGEQGPKYIPKDQYRYASMNVDALQKYGSVEFRGMRGNIDTNTINVWCKALINLREYCKNLHEPTGVFEAYASMGPERFVENALGDVFKFFKYPKMIGDIQKSFSLSLDLPYAYSAFCEEQKAGVAPVARKKLFKPIEPDEFEMVFDEEPPEEDEDD